MRISDWSSDVCSSDLLLPNRGAVAVRLTEADVMNTFEVLAMLEGMSGELAAQRVTDEELAEIQAMHYEMMACFSRRDLSGRSEEHPSELQSLMRISYAVFFLKKKKSNNTHVCESPDMIYKQPHKYTATT